VTCFYCGTELPNGAMFCGECGRPVNTRGGRSSRRAARAEAARDAAAAATSAEPVAEVPEAPVAEPVYAPVAEALDAPVADPDPSGIEAAAEAYQPVPDLFAEPLVDPLAAPEAEAEPATPPEHAPEPFAPVPPAFIAPKPSPPPAAHVPVGPTIPEPEAAAPAPTYGVPDSTLAAEYIPLPEPARTAEPAHSSAPYHAPEPESEISATQRCAQCGAPLAASDIFCPECGFVRQRTSPRARPNDTNVLDPFPWGLPRSTEPVVAHQHSPVPFEPELPAAPPAAEPATPFADTTDVSETRLVPRGPRGDRFVLQFSTGESVSVSGSGLIGRNPVAEPGEYFDTLVAIVDPGRSVSKTHLEFGQDDTSFWVSDRYSGNGTVMREPDREPRRCDAGKRYRVVRGTRVEIGEQFFIVS